MFETQFEVLESEMDRMQQFIATGISLMLASIFGACSEDEQAEWPDVTVSTCYLILTSFLSPVQCVIDNQSSSSCPATVRVVFFE